ncbi:unnamed protein product [Oreochromis niloticus]|nr:unnamed protein product [Mustela putorius furo]
MLNCDYHQLTWACFLNQQHVFNCGSNIWNSEMEYKEQSCHRIPSMVTGKRLADIGYRAFSASMMLLTVYGGYLCAMRGYRYMQRQKQLKLAAENQDPEVIKD